MFTFEYRRKTTVYPRNDMGKTQASSIKNNSLTIKITVYISDLAHLRFVWANTAQPLMSVSLFAPNNLILVGHN